MKALVISGMMMIVPTDVMGRAREVSVRVLFSDQGCVAVTLIKP
jgi:ABC-type polar amino acid transport system ATPase subunit